MNLQEIEELLLKGIHLSAGGATGEVSIDLVPINGTNLPVRVRVQKTHYRWAIAHNGRTPSNHGTAETALVISLYGLQRSRFVEPYATAC